MTAPLGLVIELPPALVPTDNLRPVDDSGPVGCAASAALGGDITSGSFRQGGDVVNAVDLTPTVAAPQAELCGRELAPDAAKKVVAQVLPLLNELGCRNDSQWWLTSGPVFPHDHAGPARLPGVLPGQGHRAARHRSGRAAGRREHAPDPAGPRRRHDRGRTQTKKSAIGYQVPANVAGWVHPAAQQSHPVKGYAPMAGVGLSLSRQVSQTLQSQSQTHATFTVKESYVRYRHTGDTELEWRTGDGKLLFTIKSQAPAETGVPQRAETGDQPPGPVAALPYVRQVRRQSGLPLPRTMTRPKVPDRYFAANSSRPSGEKAIWRGKSPCTGTVSSSRSRAPAASTAYLASVLSPRLAR